MAMHSYLLPRAQADVIVSIYQGNPATATSSDFYLQSVLPTAPAMDPQFNLGQVKSAANDASSDIFYVNFADDGTPLPTVSLAVFKQAMQVWAAPASNIVIRHYAGPTT
jgi:hypothetical protein